MSRTFYFGNATKRKNSTLQPTGITNGYDVLFKNPTSLDNPIITLNHSGDFTYNYAKYGNNYYFVRDKVARNNDLWEVSLELDALATHKTEILASKQFVAYSSVSGGTYLPDTRMPIERDATVSFKDATIDILDSSGVYILSVVGKTGVDTFIVSKANISAIINDLQTWSDNLETGVLNIVDNFDFTDPKALEKAIVAMAEMVTKTGYSGNAYEIAVQCIRSCSWVPFSSVLIGGSSDSIYLGEYPTNKSGKKINTSYITGNVGLTLPWQFNDWRRVYCESMYLYLPLVGMVQLSVDDIVSESSLLLKYSATPTDGCISYEVQAGDQIVGTYGGNCLADIPIGINQKASLGDIMTTFINGAQKTCSSALQASTSINPAGWVVGVGATAFNAAATSYNVGSAMLTSHVSTVGGLGGGAGAGLDLKAKAFSVARNTVVTPTNADYIATMGKPTQKPLLLSSCSGYCECVNAHVALNADLPIMSIVDNYLNSGFYIE